MRLAMLLVVASSLLYSSVASAAGRWVLKRSDPNGWNVVNIGTYPDAAACSRARKARLAASPRYQYVCMKL